MKERLLALALGSSLLILAVPAVHANSLATTQKSGEDTTYTRVITERAGKIVAMLGLPDSAAFLRVRTIVAGQYRALNEVYTQRDDRLKQLKDQQPAPEKNSADSIKKTIQQDVDTKVSALHTAYLSKLSTELDPQQIDKVKDGMTYSVVEVTYH